MRAALLTLSATIMLIGCTEKSQLLSEAHEAVKEQLTDPDSAKFDDNRALIYAEDGLVCDGQVNWKNRLGDYVGSQPYYYSRTTGAGVWGDFDRILKIQGECSAAQGKQTSG